VASTGGHLGGRGLVLIKALQIIDPLGTGILASQRGLY